MSDPDNSSTGPGTDWRAARRAERRARRAARRAGRPGANAGPAVGGTILVVIGVVLLAGQFGYELPERWWAALLLIPAGAALTAAIRFLRVDDGFSSRVVGALIGGLLFLGLACAFYFGLAWSLLWPALLIIVGLGLITRNYWQH